MSCKWNYDDCLNLDTECIHCILDGDRYKPRKQFKPLKQRSNNGDNRMGSSFEVAAKNKTIEDLTRLTVNSGATQREKGDMLIDGLAPLMVELKTQMEHRAKGTKSFAVKREWLDKLNREAQQFNKEFWALKFSFSETEGVQEAGKTFVVLEDSMFNQMYACIIADRKIASEADSKVNIYQKRYRTIEAENVHLHAKIEELKAELEYERIRRSNSESGEEF